MKREKCIACLLLSAFFAVPLIHGANTPEKVRTIRLVQDDGQIPVVSKIYELKHIKATDLRPFIEGVVKRYSANSKVERVNFALAKKQMIIVSTGNDFMPYVDEIIAGLDRPVKTDGKSIIDGIGITRLSYSPNYRSGEDIVRIINDILRSGEGQAFFNKESNIIYWKDDRQAAYATLAWVKYLDRPLPQANLKLNYYEIRESKLRDIGLDYLAWKNGPGLDLFAAGYNGGKIFSDEVIWQFVENVGKLADLTKNFTSSWGYGAFFTAPYFDMSFIRVLQQSGNAKLLANAELTFVNTPIYETAEMNTHLPKVYTATLTPSYETIVKDDGDKTSVIASEGSELTLSVVNPVICFASTAAQTGKQGEIPVTAEFYRNNKGSVLFAYKLDSKTITERSNQGDELGNYSTISGELTLGLKSEKLLATYIREQDVEQTIGVPFLIKIPILKYLFGTTTTIKERTYIIVTAQAEMVHPESYPSEVAAR